jgi:antitoxin HicB
MTSGRLDEATIDARVAELLKLPYRKVITGDAEQGFLAACPELPGCFTAGETEVEALELLHDAMAGWFETALRDGAAIPEPARQDDAYSGKFVLRLPKSLHRQLAEHADEDGVSLNQMAVSLIAEGLGRASAHRITITAPRPSEMGKVVFVELKTTDHHSSELLEKVIQDALVERFGAPASATERDSEHHAAVE